MLQILIAQSFKKLAGGFFYVPKFFLIKIRIIVLCKIEISDKNRLKVIFSIL